MAKSRRSRASRLSLFERFAAWCTRVAGSSWAFILAAATIVVWGVTGPLFHFSETWQLVINTGTKIGRASCRERV